jgi:hypothetical protein
VAGGHRGAAQRQARLLQPDRSGQASVDGVAGEEVDNYGG